MNRTDLYTFSDLKALYGNQQTIAAALEVDPSRVSRWKRGGIPAEKQLELLHILDNDGSLRRQLHKARKERQL